MLRSVIAAAILHGNVRGNVGDRAVAKPKHLKVQTLLAFLLTLFGILHLSFTTPDPVLGGYSLFDVLPAFIGGIWLIGALFALWWKSDK